MPPIDCLERVNFQVALEFDWVWILGWPSWCMGPRLDEIDDVFSMVLVISCYLETTALHLWISRWWLKMGKMNAFWPKAGRLGLLYLRLAAAHRCFLVSKLGHVRNPRGGLRFESKRNWLRTEVAFVFFLLANWVLPQISEMSSFDFKVGKQTMELKVRWIWFLVDPWSATCSY